MKKFGKSLWDIRKKLVGRVPERQHFIYLQNRRSMATLETLSFDNLVLRSLPVEDSLETRPHPVRNACYSRVQPTPVTNPCTVAYSVPALALLDLPESEAQRSEFAEYFSGNKILPGSETAAHCYCGHQFGSFAGQLGDGAAIYLGEVVNSKGVRWEIQLKGAGLTPYSRQADGRKVLRSSIREFLCSEAMHHLGIPTTRAGSCVTSDSKVIRDIFYDGHPIHENASLVLRIAPTFIRFGSFEIFKAMDPNTGRQGPSFGRNDILEQLTTYVIKTFYPQIWEEHSASLTSAVKAFFKEIVMRTARLVAQWQSVGWCHGVLNTDNMSIVGVTIDYGPFGFLDKFQPDFICNASDNRGRYSYSQQPSVCKWNCMKLAEALKPLVSLDELKETVDLFDDESISTYYDIMRNKLGLIGQKQAGDRELIEAFFDVLEAAGADFTNCFRSLSRVPLPGDTDYERKREQWLDYFLSQCATVAEMKVISRSRVDPRQMQMLRMLVDTNPELAEQLGISRALLDEEVNKQEAIKALQSKTDAVKSSEDREKLVAWLDKYVQRVTSDPDIDRTERVKVMNNVNPRFVLRNYIAQTAIEAAEAGDYSEVQRVLHLLQHPYADDVDLKATPDAIMKLPTYQVCHLSPIVKALRMTPNLPNGLLASRSADLRRPMGGAVLSR